MYYKEAKHTKHDLFLWQKIHHMLIKSYNCERPTDAQ